MVGCALFGGVEIRTANAHFRIKALKREIIDQLCPFRFRQPLQLLVRVNVESVR
jgi:hypothetical protein